MRRRPHVRFIIAACLTLITLSPYVGAAEPRPLFEPGATEVTFQLKDKKGNTPHLVLFRGPEQADTAESINYWRDTLDSKTNGVAVDFRGIRFLRSNDRPNDLVVRLIGIKNELELSDPIALNELQSGNLHTLHFGPAAIGFGPISGTTDAEMTLRYDPRKRMLEIPKISGQFEWKRPFYDAQKDAGSLNDVEGQIGEVPRGGAILKPAAK